MTCLNGAPHFHERDGRRGQIIEDAEHIGIAELDVRVVSDPNLKRHETTPNGSRTVPESPHYRQHPGRMSRCQPTTSRQISPSPTENRGFFHDEPRGAE
jgi:hypothetical protein